VAASVADQRAQACFGIRAKAVSRRLSFMPPAQERFGLLARLRDWPGSPS
jgi:molybdate-binding protein